MKMLQAFTTFSCATVLLTVSTAAIGSVVIVPAGHRAVVFNCMSGVEHRTLTEGTHVLAPILEGATKYDVRTQTYTMCHVHDEGDVKGDDSVAALTKDGQMIKMDLSMRYFIVPAEVWQLHQEVGPEFVGKIIRPEAQTVVRNSIAKYTVTELYSANRQQIQAGMTEEMRKGLAKYHIQLSEVLIRNISFSEDFTKAIEQKQVALQEAERMKYVLQKEESEKQRKIIAATGEAEAIRRRGDALRESPLLVKYEYVQKLAPNIKVVVADQKTIMNMGDLFQAENPKH